MNLFIEELQHSTRMEVMKEPRWLVRDLAYRLINLELKEGDIDLSSPCDPSVLDSELRDILEGLVVIEAFIRAEIEHHLRWALGKTKIMLDSGGVGCIESRNKDDIWYRSVCNQTNDYKWGNYGGFAIQALNPRESHIIISDRVYKTTIKSKIYNEYYFFVINNGYCLEYDVLSWFSKTYDYDKPIKERNKNYSYFDNFEMEGRTIRELINEEYPDCFSS
tara:strand:+ start:103 stop:762 length:660 start_codon:yes stop_codon:yes gene_type:complete